MIFQPFFHGFSHDLRIFPRQDCHGTSPVQASPGSARRGGHLAGALGHAAEGQGRLGGNRGGDHIHIYGKIHDHEW